MEVLLKKGRIFRYRFDFHTGCKRAGVLICSSSNLI
jgi:hypothetical protein